MRSRSMSTGLLLFVGLAVAGCNPATTSGVGESMLPSATESRLMQLAADVEARGDYDTAAALYARAAQGSGDAPELQLKLGNAYLKVGNYSAASEAFAKVLASNPKHPDALLGLGTAQLKRGDVESGARTLGQAVPLVNTPTAYSRLGTAQIMLGRFDAALEAFEHARSLAPDDLDNVANLALAQALAGRTEEAVAAMQDVARQPAARPRHQANLVLILAIAGRTADAMAVSSPDLPAAEKRSLVARAKKVRDARDPMTKARAVGLVNV